MNSDNYDVIYCADDDDYRVYCNHCDKSCLERYYKNHLISKTQTNNVHKRQQINKSIQIISLI